MKSWLTMYNSMIIPIMTYGSEIWMSDDFKLKFKTLDKSPFEKTQNTILKNLLGVHGRSSNMAIKCELGAFPVVLRCYKPMFNYFLRFRECGGLMDGIHNILKAAFAEDQLLLKKEHSWSNKMYEILNLFQLSSTIISKSFNKKIEDFYKDKLKSELCRIKHNNSGKIRFYGKMFGNFELQRYLKL